MKFLHNKNTVPNIYENSVSNYVILTYKIK